MCGIYLTNIPFTKEEVSKKLDLIKYRGPDFKGIKKECDLIFGHLRLSILDLESRSNQPMQYMGLTLVYNGEIYNFKEIKNELVDLGVKFDTTSDTEVLLKGYNVLGEELIPKLNGMFAFAIYDKKKGKIFCYRDRLGVKPFYFFWNKKNGEFEICSQLKPLVDKEKKINEKSISIYLECGYIPSPYSIFEDIYKLPSGAKLEIDLKNKTYEVSKYWDLKEVKKTSLSYEEAKVELHKLLKDAVKIRLNSDVPFCTFLSGGIDSALVTSIAQNISDDQIKTFSIGFENPEYDESIIAKKISEILGTSHVEKISKVEDVLDLIPDFVKVYDEPFADSSALPSLLLNKVTKEHVTMALSGDGGDESFLGYNHFDFLNKYKGIFAFPYFLRNVLAFLIPKNTSNRKLKSIKYILKFKSLNYLIKNTFIGSTHITKKRDYSWFKTFSDFENKSNDFIQRAADLNIKLWLEGDSNTKVDRASMAFSVEVRSPFLDYRLVEFARTLPVSYRYEKNVKKRILRDILKEYVPESITNLPKKGFSVPMEFWIRNELKTEIINNLSDDFLNLVPNLDVKKIKKMLNQHLEGIDNYSTYIWRVYVLSKWYQEFGFYEKRNKN